MTVVVKVASLGVIVVLAVEVESSSFSVVGDKCAKGCKKAENGVYVVVEDERSDIWGLCMWMN